LAILLFSTTAYGGGGTSPTNNPSANVPAEVAISVTATGFKPPDAVVAVGRRATFINNDDPLHSIASLPITTHADCPSINEVGVLVPGQSPPTGVFSEAKTCGYHDAFSESGQLLTGSTTVR
jgi:plastocyanin